MDWSPPSAATSRPAAPGPTALSRPWLDSAHRLRSHASRYPVGCPDRRERTSPPARPAGRAQGPNQDKRPGASRTRHRHRPSRSAAGADRSSTRRRPGRTGRNDETARSKHRARPSGPISASVACREITLDLGRPPQRRATPPLSRDRRFASIIRTLPASVNSSCRPRPARPSRGVRNIVAGMMLVEVPAELVAQS